MAIQKPKFGERAVSWQAVSEDAYPADEHGPEAWQAYHDDADAAEMNRLRGLVMVQASETEAVLGRILRHLDPSVNLQRPAGILLRSIERLLDEEVKEYWAYELSVIEEAIKRRNRVVHDTVGIGSVWRDYATGGGEWVSVISFLGDEQCSEANLIEDLALQQDATEFAVHILYALERQPSADNPPE